MAQQTFKELLKELNACNDAVIWAGNMTIEQVVADCQRGDWLLWLAFNINIDKHKLTLAKGHCANTVRHLMKDERSIKAIDATIDYGNGLIDDEQLKTAAYAADAADAATYAANSATYAARAAADSADYAAAAAAASAAASAGYTANSATYAARAAAASADYAAKKQNEMQTADICRENIGELIISKVNELLNK